ncbi:ArsR family transcriptional regulator [Actinoallomurus iriomotensis]|uniref:ArsR family transcriptional regulator n=1 Tax=Actinoallomurus iriomotensis TaxID=478107 RepID=UPI0025563FB4|nr:ArsR family transcriptional regulator [Actinoallomurus iriomotensis]
MARLRQGPCPVGELADAVGMERSAVSHQPPPPAPPLASSPATGKDAASSTASTTTTSPPCSTKPSTTSNASASARSTGSRPESDDPRPTQSVTRPGVVSARVQIPALR